MHNWEIDEEELTSEKTKKKFSVWIKESEIDMEDSQSKIYLIRKHRELFGSDFLTAKKSIEKMFY